MNGTVQYLIKVLIYVHIVSSFVTNCVQPSLTVIFFSSSNGATGMILHMMVS